VVIDRRAMARQALTGQTEAAPVDIAGSWRGEGSGQTDRICTGKGIPSHEGRHVKVLLR